MSFGVLAEPVMGSVAPIAMSILVISGGLLMNARWLPMSFAVTPSLRGRTSRRALEAQAIVDASFVIADHGDGTFDRNALIARPSI